MEGTYFYADYAWLVDELCLIRIKRSISNPPKSSEKSKTEYKTLPFNRYWGTHIHRRITPSKQAEITQYRNDLKGAMGINDAQQSQPTGDAKNMVLIKATITDVPMLADLRKLQLHDEGIKASQNIDKELLQYFVDSFGNDTLVEWVAESEGNIIATAAIAFYQFPPTYTNASGMKGYVTNMYTAPNYRGQGIATKLLSELQKEAQRRNVKKLFLIASEMGRPVYTAFEFNETDKYLEKDIDNVQ